MVCAMEEFRSWMNKKRQAAVTLCQSGNKMAHSDMWGAWGSANAGSCPHPGCEVGEEREGQERGSCGAVPALGGGAGGINPRHLSPQPSASCWRFSPGLKLAGNRLTKGVPGKLAWRAASSMDSQQGSWRMGLVGNTKATLRGAGREDFSEAVTGT